MYRISKNLPLSPSAHFSTSKYKLWKRKSSRKPKISQRRGEEILKWQWNKAPEKSYAAYLENSQSWKEQGTQVSRKNVPRKSKKQNTWCVCLQCKRFHRFVGEFEGELVTGMYKLQDLLEPTPKEDVLSITGDWNAKAERQETAGVTGKLGLGVQNEAGQRLTEFCQRMHWS